MKLSNVTIGADPEVFVSQGTQILSAIGTIGGSKEAPRPVRSGAVQEDNVLAEFNINPAHNLQEFISNIKDVYGDMSDILLQHKLQPMVISSHRFKKQQLESWGEKAMEFGCSSEYDAWTTKVLKKPNASSTLRTAGGHIHIGYDNPDEGINNRIAQIMDYTLAIPSVLVDTDKLRRKMYGKPGAVRHKPYGVEYRTLSNFWIASEELMTWAYNQTVAVTQDLSILDTFMSVVSPKEVQDVILKSDEKRASEICNQLGLVLP